MPNPLSLQSARDLARDRAIRLAMTEAHGDKLSIGLDIGIEIRPLASQRDPVRLFRTVEAALRILKSIGIMVAIIDARQRNLGQDNLLRSVR